MNRTPLLTGSVQREARARGADVWTYRYRDGKRHRSLLLGRTDQLTFEAAYRKARGIAEGVFENRMRITVAALVDRYSTEEMPTRGSTAASYRSMLSRIRRDWGDVHLDDMLSDLSAVERWLRTMQTMPRYDGSGKVVKPAEPASHRTITHLKALLHRLVERAMFWGVVDVQRNPIALTEIRGTVRRKRVMTLLTAEQYAALLERPELGEHCRVMVQLAMCLGLRRSEILGLQWDDVNLLEGEVHIQRSSVGRFQDGTKTDCSEAVLPLHSSLVSLLMAWRQRSSVVGGWVFGSPATGRPYHGDSLQTHHLVPAGRKIGLPRLGWHDFRHTHRALLRDLGLPLEVQQKLMRHADISMTTKYGNGPMDQAKRDANRLLVEHVSQMENGSTRIV